MEEDFKSYGLGLYSARGLALKCTKEEFAKKVDLKQERISTRTARTAVRSRSYKSAANRRTATRLLDNLTEEDYWR